MHPSFYWKLPAYCLFYGRAEQVSIPFQLGMSVPSLSTWISDPSHCHRTEDGVSVLGHLSSPHFPAFYLTLTSFAVCSVTQWCLTLCNPLDCSPPGSSVHGISQARILEWVAISSSKGSSRPSDRPHVSYVSWVAGRFFICWVIGEVLYDFMVADK